MSEEAYLKGVSVLICCYNSAKRLPETLAYLSKQVVRRDIRWEVIIINNASTDDTLQIAQSVWREQEGGEHFSIIQEPIPGLLYARERGMKEARYEYILFCDDDNWLNPEYIQTAYAIMEANPDIGALGGQGIPVFEGSKPKWFDHCSGAFAVGAQTELDGEILLERCFVYGAGAVYRRSVINSLQQSGFKNFLTGRTKNNLLSSEDVELGYAIRLHGYKNWYDGRLKFQHYIPSNRLNWKYLKRLQFGIGYSRVFLRPYQRYLLVNTSIKYTYYTYLLNVIFLLFRETGSLVKYYFTKHHESVVINWQLRLGELYSLIQNREKYKELDDSLKKAAWIRTKVLKSYG